MKGKIIDDRRKSCKKIQKESSINNNHNVTDSDSKCGNYSYFN